MDERETATQADAAEKPKLLRRKYLSVEGKAARDVAKRHRTPQVLMLAAIEQAAQPLTTQQLKAITGCAENTINKHGRAMHEGGAIVRKMCGNQASYWKPGLSWGEYEPTKIPRGKLQLESTGRQERATLASNASIENWRARQSLKRTRKESAQPRPEDETASKALRMQQWASDSYDATFARIQAAR